MHHYVRFGSISYYVYEFAFCLEFPQSGKAVEGSMEYGKLS